MWGGSEGREKISLTLPPYPTDLSITLQMVKDCKTSGQARRMGLFFSLCQAHCRIYSAIFMCFAFQSRGKEVCWFSTIFPRLQRWSMSCMLSWAAHSTLEESLKWNIWMLIYLRKEKNHLSQCVKFINVDISNSQKITFQRCLMSHIRNLIYMICQCFGFSTSSFLNCSTLQLFLSMQFPEKTGSKRA